LWQFKQRWKRNDSYPVDVPFISNDNFKK
jgi:hypothetical protein